MFTQTGLQPTLGPQQRTSTVLRQLPFKSSELSAGVSHQVVSDQSSIIRRPKGTSTQRRGASPGSCPTENTFDDTGEPGGRPSDRIKEPGRLQTTGGRAMSQKLGSHVGQGCAPALRTQPERVGEVEGIACCEPVQVEATGESDGIFLGKTSANRTFP